MFSKLSVCVTWAVCAELDSICCSLREEPGQAACHRRGRRLHAGIQLLGRQVSLLGLFDFPHPAEALTCHVLKRLALRVAWTADQSLMGFWPLDPPTLSDLESCSMFETAQDLRLMANALLQGQPSDQQLHVAPTDWTGLCAQSRCQFH